MLACLLYKHTTIEEYRTYAARIYFNGFASMQSPNGGAGTDTTVSNSTHVLHSKMYEAYFCCTMRLSEELKFVSKNRYILYANTFGKIEKDCFGRYFDGNMFYAETDSEFEKYVDEHCYVCGLNYFRCLSFINLKTMKYAKKSNKKYFLCKNQ